MHANSYSILSTEQRRARPHLSPLCAGRGRPAARSVAGRVRGLARLFLTNELHRSGRPSPHPSPRKSGAREPAVAAGARRRAAGRMIVMPRDRRMTLSTQSNFPDPDAAYRLIVEAHRGLDDEQSAALDAALVLILANHIGDLDVLREAVALAKRRIGAHTPRSISGRRHECTDSPRASLRGRSDEAIQCLCSDAGLLRFARNDGLRPFDRTTALRCKDMN